MTDDLLGYYNRELSLLRQHAARFADAHPKVAARLRLGPDGSEDPHVERLLEGVSFLTAGVRQKLDAGYSGMAETLLGVLYPHYLAPVPSCFIAQMDLDRGQNELAAGLHIPAGQGVETDPIQGEPCRFRTAYPLSLWPVDVAAAELKAAPFTAPRTNKSGTAAAVLRLRFQVRAKGLAVGALAARSLRLHLHGQSLQVNRLYELLFRSVVQVAYATGPDDPAPAVVEPAAALKPVGFERTEALLPHQPHTLPGYRLLTEYFAFPPKFHFVDLALPPAAVARCGGSVDVFFYLNRSVPELEPHVSPEAVRLGCVPAVNLYSHRAEPIRLSHTDPDYRVVPDVRRPLAHEVYSVDRVIATAPDGTEAELKPLYTAEHHGTPSGLFTHAARRPADGSGTRDATPDRGSEVYLSVIDRTASPAPPAGWVLHVETTCLNRDLPARLPFGEGVPRLQLAQGGAAVGGVRAITPPTPTLRPKAGPESLWRLVSHLSLNHLSLSGGVNAAAALRSILTLYDVADRPETRSAIDGLVAVDTRRITGRLNGGLGRGVQVTATFEEERYAGRELFLFASVLERFVGLYASLNTFTRLAARLAAQDREYHTWPTRAGERATL